MENKNISIAVIDYTAAYKTEYALPELNPIKYAVTWAAFTLGDDEYRLAIHPNTVISILNELGRIKIGRFSKDQQSVEVYGGWVDPMTRGCNEEAIMVNIDDYLKSIIDEELIKKIILYCLEKHTNSIYKI